MKITDLDVRVVHINKRGNWVFLFIHTDSGITGLGEASQTANDKFMVESFRQIRSRIQGEDPLEILKVYRKINPMGPFQNQFMQATASAVEMALWDICGKAAEMPVYKLLGGKVHSAVRLYANINRGLVEKTAEEYAEMAQRAVNAGFNAVKCDPFDGVYRYDLASGESWKSVIMGLERLRAVRSAIGDNIDLMVDAHTRFNYPTARELCARLEEFNLFWLEDPVDITQTNDWRKIKAEYCKPLAGGEVLWNRNQFRQMLDQDCLDVLMPDVKYCGGIKELKWISDLADSYGVLISPHGPSGPVSLAAGAHAMLGTANFLTLEFAFGEVDWREELTRGSEHIIDGQIQIPENPGLGIELDPKIIDKFSVDL